MHQAFVHGKRDKEQSYVGKKGTQELKLRAWYSLLNLLLTVPSVPGQGAPVVSLNHYACSVHCCCQGALGSRDITCLPVLAEALAHISLAAQGQLLSLQLRVVQTVYLVNFFHCPR